MDNFQKTFRALLAKETSRERLLARLLIKKLKGIAPGSASLTLEAVEAAVARSLAENPSLERLTISIDSGQGKSDGEAVPIEFTSGDLDELEKGIEEILSGATESFVDTLATSCLQSIKEESQEVLGAHEDEVNAFRSNLLRRWKKPLHLLSAYLRLTREIGDNANTWLRKRGRRSRQILTIEALTRLHARACQVAAEVEALLLAGFADGALSRWRTLHEIAVIGWFISDHGIAVAERYLDHLYVDSLRMARTYQRQSAALGYSAISAREFNTIERRAKKLEVKYGKSFMSEYGWAASALSKERPTFADIEEAIDFAKFRPHYKLASSTVHAGPKGAYFRIGMLPGGEEILLTGMSNAGLDEAGQLTAISLSQMTVALLQLKTTVDTLVWSKVSLNLSGQVAEAFVKEGRRLARDERRVRRRG